MFISGYANTENVFYCLNVLLLSLMNQSHDVNIMYIPGKDPAMVFLDADNKVVLVCV